ncbi:hypothetical protein [Streptomyces sp. WMMC897]|uniref:hypothetical protein n=1 Tax=Streptomyces sp. WMMC897 TaxID=3014782 RepID=UPI0022B74E33|nr:hypothetical protein [Streptomyces sp. WMMC897]MCZ7416845.1 hypothetical protein [Streptomyces sp. WMMC897]
MLALSLASGSPEKIRRATAWIGAQAHSFPDSADKVNIVEALADAARASTRGNA